MYAIRVQINNAQPVVGGAGDLSVLSAILTLTGKLGSGSRPHRDDGSVDFTFRLGGLTSRGPGVEDEHLVWLEDNELKLGDKLTFEIVESESPSTVESGSKAEERANDERSYYEHCKRAYFEMREKYERDA
jgi:hypothetical protein